MTHDPIQEFLEDFGALSSREEELLKVCQQAMQGLQAQVKELEAEAETRSDILVGKVAANERLEAEALNHLSQMQDWNTQLGRIKPELNAALRERADAIQRADRLAAEVEALKNEKEVLHATIHGMQDGAVVRDQMALIERQAQQLADQRAEIENLKDGLSISTKSVMKENDKLLDRVDSQQATTQGLVEALEAVLKWRDGPEGPEVLFEEGATMIKQANAALAAGKGKS